MLNEDLEMLKTQLSDMQRKINTIIRESKNEGCYDLRHLDYARQGFDNGFVWLFRAIGKKRNNFNRNGNWSL